MNKHIENVGASILSFLLIYFTFMIAKLENNMLLWVFVLISFLIYFELWDKK